MVVLVKTKITLKIRQRGLNLVPRVPLVWHDIEGDLGMGYEAT